MAHHQSHLLRMRGRRRDHVRAGAVIAIALVAASATALGSAAQGSPAPQDGKGGHWKILKPTNTGIPGDYVLSVAVDGKDRPWVTANDPIWDEGGLGTFTGSRWRQWTNVDGKSPTHESRSLKYHGGTWWMASSVGLLRLDGRKIRTVFDRQNAPWPTNVVRDFDWDSKGNLWVALNDVKTVNGGVARYDGTKWKVWTTANGLPWSPPWDQVSALEIDDQDRVWIGSPVFGGAVYDAGTWTALGNGEGTWVYDIAIAPDGTPWYVFVSNGVQTWENGHWVDRTGPVGSTSASLVTIDSTGRVWVGTFIGRIWRWSGSGASYDLSYDPPSLGSHIYSLAFDSKNQPYVGGIGGMDVRHNNGTWSVYTTLNTALPSRWVDDVTVDSDGNGWFATAGGGLARYDGIHWRDFNPYNWGTEPWPFPTDAATSVVQAADGSIWTSPTHAGVGRWDGKTWTGYLTNLSIRSLAIDPAQRVWAAPDRGEVQRWNGKRWTGMGNPSGNADLFHIAADSKGDIWLTSSIGLMRYDGTTWTTYNDTNSGLPSQFVLTVTPEPSGDAVWVGTDKGLARFDGADWTVYTEADGLPANVINSIAFAPDGDVWIGAFDGTNYPYHGGLGHFDGTTWTSYTRENSPLPHNQVQSVDVDAQGRVWIATQSEGTAIFTP